MSIFYPRKVPSVESKGLSSYGEESVSTLLAHYGTERPAEVLQSEEKTKEAIVSSDISTESKTFCQVYGQEAYRQHEDAVKGLFANEMFKSMFPNLSKLAAISLSIPVATASVERNFSQMKLIKTRLRSILKDSSLSGIVDSYMA